VPFKQWLLLYRTAVRPTQKCVAAATIFGAAKDYQASDVTFAGGFIGQTVPTVRVG
jgi:hypothetical protein